MDIHIIQAKQCVAFLNDAELMAESYEYFRRHQAREEAGKELDLEDVEVGSVFHSELCKRGYAFFSGEGWKKWRSRNY